MIRFELSPQPCQPRVIESASHIRYPNIDCQSAVAKLACKHSSVASATAFNTNLHQRTASTPLARFEREISTAKRPPLKNFSGSHPTYQAHARCARDRSVYSVRRSSICQNSTPVVDRRPAAQQNVGAAGTSEYTMLAPLFRSFLETRNRAPRPNKNKAARLSAGRSCALSESNREPTD
jgi:hypothetical protein